MENAWKHGWRMVTLAECCHQICLIFLSHSPSHKQCTNCSFLVLLSYFSTQGMFLFSPPLVLSLAVSQCTVPTSPGHGPTNLPLCLLPHLVPMHSLCPLQDLGGSKKERPFLASSFVPWKNPSWVSIAGRVVLLLNHRFSFELTDPKSACVSVSPFAMMARELRHRLKADT